MVKLFPNRDFATRRVGRLLQDQHEERQYEERRYISDISLLQLAVILINEVPDPTRWLRMTA